MRTFIVTLGAAIILVSSGCSQETQNQTSEPENTQAGETFSIEEISTHNSPTDCWLLIDGKIYDVTNFIPGHPGGSTILEGCGKDATELFNKRPMGSGTPHSERAQNGLEQYYIGNLK